MTDSLDALEARVRAAVERAKAQPKQAIEAQLRGARDQAMQTPRRSTKRVLNRHAKMLVDASAAHMEDVGETMREILAKGVYSDEGFDSVVHALKSSQDAFSAYQLAAQSIVEDLTRERNELRAELGHENTKRAHRREAAGFVAAGAVTLLTVAGEYVSAEVRDGTQKRAVQRQEKRWSCDCLAPGQCAHVRATQLLTYKSAADLPTSTEPDGKSLAAAGALWVRSNEQQRGLAEVVDNGEVFTVARQGYGGYSCTCGSMNAKCAHGDAVRFVVG